MDYRTIYVGSQMVFGILFLVLLYLRHANNRGQGLDKLDTLYCLFLITIILDSVWMLINGVAEYRTWHVLLQVVYLCTMALTGYTWFLYTLDQFPAKSMPIRKYRFVLGIPVLVIMVLIICSAWTNWVFVVDEGGNYIRGDIHPFAIGLNYSYMLLGSYVALHCRKEALITMDKRRFAATALFPIPILLLSLAQLLLPPGLPAMQGGVLIAFMLLYGTSQNVMITRDHLTGLPNRFAFEQDLLERIHHHRPNSTTHLYLMEGDLNKFKHINDTYGHPAGDKALRQTANALSKACTPYKIAVFRTGGDEFMMIAETNEVLDVAKLTKEINENMKEVETPDDVGLTMSVGMVEYTNNVDFRILIENVDQELYAAKKADMDNASSAR